MSGNKTLALRDHGLPHTSEAAMCKWLAPKTAVEVIHQCLLTHGHAGYSKDLPHQQRLRDVMGLEIGDGTAQIMKLVIARERIGRVAVQSVLGQDVSLASLRGKTLRYQDRDAGLDIPVLVTYHPAYLLRNLPDKAKAWEDLCRARALMRSLAADAAA